MIVLGLLPVDETCFPGSQDYFKTVNAQLKQIADRLTTQLKARKDIKEENIKPQVDHFIFPNGKRITSTKAGAYTITVQDRSAFHNFALSGPSLRKSTTVNFVGVRTWNVTLRKFSQWS